MDDSSGRKFQKELNGGLVGLVLLAVLAQSDEDLYGYEIAKRLASANEGTSIFKEGTSIRCCGPCPRVSCSRAASSPRIPDRRAATTASRSRGARCFRN